MNLSEIATEEALSRMSVLERFELQVVLHSAKKHGYGNFMSWLATAWAMKLMDEIGEDAAIDAVSGRGPLFHPLSNLRRPIKPDKKQSIRLAKSLTGTTERIPSRLKKAVKKHRKQVQK